MVKLDMKQVVAAVVQLLQQRQSARCVVSPLQLQQPLAPALLALNGTMRIRSVDWGLLQQLRRFEPQCPVTTNLFEALSYGVRVELELHPSLLALVTMADLQRSPWHWFDHANRPLHYCAKRVVSHSDLLRLTPGWLLLLDTSLITPLARETLAQRQLELLITE